jgi:hypothetical protein
MGRVAQSIQSWRKIVSSRPKGYAKFSLLICNVANEEIDREDGGNLLGPLEYLL